MKVARGWHFVYRAVDEYGQIIDVLFSKRRDITAARRSCAAAPAAHSELRPMRGLKTDRTAGVIMSGHAFVQNIRRRHEELGVEARHDQRPVAAAFDDFATTI